MSTDNPKYRADLSLIAFAKCRSNTYVLLDPQKRFLEDWNCVERATD